MPRAAMSVATSMWPAPVGKRSSARVRAVCDLLPWITSAGTPSRASCRTTRSAPCLVRVNTSARPTAPSWSTRRSAACAYPPAHEHHPLRAAARHWLAELLPVGYFHLVFTLPGPIADIAYQNKRVIYDPLFKASAQAMLIVAADPKHLGARLGITALLHTWGSAMTHHPHVHMIVPSGGLSADQSSWISSRPRFLIETFARGCEPKHRPQRAPPLGPRNIS
jgi:hypothetical protein